MTSINHEFKKTTQTELEVVMNASIYPRHYQTKDCNQEFEYVEQFNDDLTPRPPYTNRGGKHTDIDNTGLLLGTPATSFHCIVDYLSFTFSMHGGPSSLEIVDDLLANLCGIISNLKHYPQKKGLFGYKQSMGLARLDQQVGLLGFDGNNNTCYVSLSGQGCSSVDMFLLRAYIEKLPECKITRIDLAHDDLEGLTTVDDYKYQYQVGEFHIHGNMPSARYIDDMGTGKGCTFYVGNKANGKEACIYQKGKQLGDVESPWVRVEGRITSVDRVIPFDTMTVPEQFLAALYPPFSGLSEKHRTIDIIKKHCAIVLERLIDHCMVSYGRLVNVMLESGDYDEFGVCNRLRVDGVPKRLLIPFGQLENSIPF